MISYIGNYHPTVRKVTLQMNNVLTEFSKLNAHYTLVELKYLNV